MTPFTFIFSTYYQSRASKAELCKHAIPKGMSKKMFLRCLVYPPYAYNLRLSLVKAFSLPLFIQAKLMFLFTSRDYGLSILKGSDGNCVTSRFSHHPFIHSHVASEFQIHLAPILAWIHYESSSGQPARRGSTGLKCHVRGGGSRRRFLFLQQRKRDTQRFRVRVQVRPTCIVCSFTTLSLNYQKNSKKN